MSSFFRQALDLPLGERTPTRWIGWLAAALVALTVTAAALATAATRAASHEALAPTLVTVLLPARDGGPPGEGEVAEVAAALSAIPGVAFARPVVAAELGLAPLADSAPLPRLLELALNPGHLIDLATLTARVTAIVPDATVASGGRQPHAGWSADAIRDLALGGSAAGLLALMLVVAGLTRLSLVVHRDTIDLLRQLGADDGYIARQLGQHALGGTLRGGIIGLLVGLTAFVGLMSLPGDRLPPLAMGPLDWLAPSLVPPVAAILARLAAGLAARPRLR